MYTPTTHTQSESIWYEDLMWPLLQGFSALLVLTSCKRVFKANVCIMGWAYSEYAIPICLKTNRYGICYKASSLLVVICCVLCSQHYGYSRITTTADTLVFEYVRNDDGKVHDTLELKKQ